MKPFLAYGAIALAFSLSCEKVSKPLNPFLPDDGKDPVSRTIVFVSDRETRPFRQIYAMNSDGTQITRITHTSDDFINPNFSPDGKRILAVSITTTDSDEIWLMDADGGNLKNLSQSPGDDNFASFSPDGSRILFSSTRDGNSEIYVMDSDGRNPIRLTDSGLIDHSPQFTADGLRIVYCSTQIDPFGNDYQYDIISMNTDGSDKKCLTRDSSYFLSRYHFGGSPQGKEILIRLNVKPNFSSDGSQIVFTSHNADTDFNRVLMMDADGTDHRLVYGEDDVILPVLFAPGDQTIIFNSHRANKVDIYDMALDGSNQRDLTGGVPGHVAFSEISPDLSQIVFSTDVPISGYRYEKIWVMSPNGVAQTQLTFGESNDSYPHYQPITPDSP